MACSGGSSPGSPAPPAPAAPGLGPGRPAAGSAGSLTDVQGIGVGHWADARSLTGCTVVLCPEGAVAGVDVRGSAPGTRETDLMRPGNLVERLHAAVLTGGSAFGLAAAQGVMNWCEAHGIGFSAGGFRVPIVGAAVIFDLDVGDGRVRPGPAEGERACETAAASLSGETVAPEATEGSVGAGMGATVGKAFGPRYRMRGGLGMASLRVAGGLTVAALAVVNALGDVYDPDTGAWVAGAYDRERRARPGAVGDVGSAGKTASGGPFNTTLAVVATNAALSKEQANKVAQMAHDGLARAIRPVHTMWDGDAVFCMATGAWRGPAAAEAGRRAGGGAAAQRSAATGYEAPIDAATLVSHVGSLASEAVARAVVRGVQLAAPGGPAGPPSWSELFLSSER